MMNEYNYHHHYYYYFLALVMYYVLKCQFFPIVFLTREQEERTV